MLIGSFKPGVKYVINSAGGASRNDVAIEGIANRINNYYKQIFDSYQYNNYYIDYGNRKGSYASTAVVELGDPLGKPGETVGYVYIGLGDIGTPYLTKSASGKIVKGGKASLQRIMAHEMFHAFNDFSDYESNVKYVGKDAYFGIGNRAVKFANNYMRMVHGQSPNLARIYYGKGFPYSKPSGSRFSASPLTGSVFYAKEYSPNTLEAALAAMATGVPHMTGSSGITRATGYDPHDHDGDGNSYTYDGQPIPRAGNFDASRGGYVNHRGSVVKFKNSRGSYIYMGGRNEGNSRGNSGSNSGESEGEGAGKPIVLDLDGDGVELTSDMSTAFDWDNDGFVEASGWVGADDGLLVIDLNNDGKITQSKELALSEWHEDARTDFEGLKLAFDSNNDGVFDARDARFGEFRVWNDADGDAEVDEGEFKTLAEADVVSIDLINYKSMLGDDATDGMNIGSNIIYGTSTYKKKDGSTGLIADVAFKYNKSGFRIDKDGKGGYQVVREVGGTGLSYISTLGQKSAHAKIDGFRTLGAFGDDRGNTFNASYALTDVVLDGQGGADYLYGGHGDDSLLGGDGNDYLSGNVGNDMLIGGKGVDRMYGGKGHDTLIADTDDNFGAVRGGEGHDTLIIEGKKNLSLNANTLQVEVLYSADGNDRLWAGRKEGTFIHGGGGNDYIYGAAGNDVFQGGTGNDYLYGYAGNDTLLGDDGNDYINAGAGDDTLHGGAGADRMYGGDGNDTYIYARGDGKDYIYDYAYATAEDKVMVKYGQTLQSQGGKRARYVNELRTGYRQATGTVDAGIDTIKFVGGISVHDVMIKRSGWNMAIAIREYDSTTGAELNKSFAAQSDQILVQNHFYTTKFRIEQLEFVNGNLFDTSNLAHGYVGGVGNDFFVGSNSNDWINTGDGNDVVHARFGDDVIASGAGADQIHGYEGNDFLFAGQGNDYADGNQGDDYVLGEEGNDHVRGSGGNDTLSGGSGNDALYGGTGNDTLYGGTGNDRMEGGAGDDTYLYMRGDGHDTIYDHHATLETKTEWTGRYQWRGGGKHARLVREYRTVSYWHQHNGGNDTLQFGWSVNIQDLFAFRSGANLVIALREEGENGVEKRWQTQSDRLTVQNWANVNNRIEKFVFGNGFEIDTSNIVHFRSEYEGNDFISMTNEGDFVSAGAGNDTIYTHAGDDIAIGGKGDDHIVTWTGKDDLYGGDGNDHLHGQQGDDVLHGGAGNDRLYGGSGNDILTGGSGDDYMHGGAGDDTYHFGRGYGKDTIDETATEVVQQAFYYNARVAKSVGWGKSRTTVWVNERRLGYRGVVQNAEGGNDTLQLGFGIFVSDLITKRVGNNLVIDLAPLEGTNGQIGDDQLTIRNWHEKKFRIEEFRFSNGFMIDMSNVTTAKTGTDGGDRITSSATHQWLSGRGGNDFITAHNYNDILIGGKGNDRIYGYNGDDTYVFGVGDGHDVYWDRAGKDNLLFDEGITIDHLKIERIGNTMEFTVLNRDHLNQHMLDNSGVAAAFKIYKVMLAYETKTLVGNYWAKQFDAGHSFASLTNRIANGSSFKARYGTLSNQDFASWAFQAITGEAATSDQLNEWTAKLTKGTTRGQMVADLFESDAGKAKWDRATLEYLYGIDSYVDDYSESMKRTDWAESVQVLHWHHKPYRIETLQFFSGQDFDFTDIDYAWTGNKHGEAKTGTAGGDWLDAGRGNDSINGYFGNDFILGRAGNDTLNGHYGDDVISGGEGNDRIYGSNGDDTLVGDSGNDTIYGQNNSDVLMGGEGNDYLHGGAGNDMIIGGEGNDTIHGSHGQDYYRFGYGDGRDTIYTGDNGQDAVIFEDDVKQDQIWFQRIGDDLSAKLLGSEDSMTFKSYFRAGWSSWHRNQGLRGFKAGDKYLSGAEVHNLVNAMARFEPNDGSTAYGITSDKLPSQIQLAVNTYWRAA